MTMKTMFKMTALVGLLAWALPAQAGKFSDLEIFPSSGAYFIGYPNGAGSLRPGLDIPYVFLSSGAALVQSTATTSAHKPFVVKNAAGTDVFSVSQGGDATGTFVGNVTGNASGTAGALAAGGAGQLPYQSASGVTAFMPSMGSGGIITGNGSGVVPSTATLAGTANQITVTKTATAVTLSGAGATTTCSAGQYPNSLVTNGGIATSFSCAAANSLQAGTPVQIAFTSSTVSAVGTSNDMVMDTTIPQITEGDQVIASTMTPFYSTSKLRVQASTWVSEDTNTSSVGIICCIFRDSTANSIGGCKIENKETTGEGSLNQHFAYAGETIVNSNAASATVFSLRCGLFGSGAASSIRWLGEDGAGLLGGGMSTNIVVTEVYYP